MATFAPGEHRYGAYVTVSGLQVMEMEGRNTKFNVAFVVQRTLIAAASCPNSKIIAAGYRYALACHFSV